MRIAFTLIGNSRRSGYLDGESMRYGGVGGSGTDTSTILVAEYLAAQGHEVVVTQDPLEPKLAEEQAAKGRYFNSGRVVNGVQYCDIEFTGVENKSFDVLVNSLWFQDYETLPITVSKAVIYWCHMQWIYGIGELIQYAKTRNLALGFVHISEWEKGMNAGITNHADIAHGIKTALIPNPEPDDVIRKVLAENIQRKPHKFIFHAAWPRGGDVALEVVRRLPYEDKEFHAFDYLMIIHQHTDAFFHMHDGVDKLTLYRHLAEAEYFVYPLYTPYEDVHKDTFSCVVADAIALGCTPVTYPLGALPENFEGYCHWVPFPTGKSQAEMQAESLSKDIPGAFKSEEAITNFTDAVLYLEQNADLKNKIRQDGSRFILDKLNVAAVGQRWVTFIEELAGGHA
jgi:glycosyltransferase involved in cell wall biosynthesis